MDEDQKKVEEKIDWFDVAVIMAFIVGFFGDFSFILIITHYFCGLIVLALIGPKLKRFTPKLILGAAFLLPGPCLMLGTFFAILFENSKIAEFIVEQAAIQGLALATAGIGELAEGAVLAEEGVEIAATAAETAGVAAEGVELGEAAEEGAEAAEESGKSFGERAGEKIEAKAKEKLQQKLQDKLSSGENEDDAREEIEEEEKKEEADEARYREITESDAQKDEIENLEKRYFEDQNTLGRKPVPNPKVKVMAAPQSEAQRKLNERNKKIQQVQEQFQKPKQPKVITLEKSDDDDKEDNFAKAA